MYILQIANMSTRFAFFLFEGVFLVSLFYANCSLCFNDKFALYCSSNVLLYRRFSIEQRNSLFCCLPFLRQDCSFTATSYLQLSMMMTAVVVYCLFCFIFARWLHKAEILKILLDSFALHFRGIAVLNCFPLIGLFFAMIWFKLAIFDGTFFSFIPPIACGFAYTVFI